MTTAEKLRAEGRAQGEALGRAQGEALGRAQGEALGRAQGEAEGMARVLLEQLTVKFGPQPVEVQARVFTATSEQLHTWARRILAATSVDEVLG